MRLLLVSVSLLTVLSAAIGAAWWLGWRGQDQAGPVAASEVIILTSERLLAGKFAMVRDAARQSGISVTTIYVEQTDQEALRRAVAGAGLLLVDAPMAQRAVSELLTPLEDLLPPYVKISSTEFQAGGVDRDRAEKIWQYYRSGGEENMRRLFIYLQNRFFQENQVEVAAPIIFPDSGIYHPRYPEMVFADPVEYFSWLQPDSAQPVIGISFPQSFLASGLLGHIDDLINHLEQQGAVALPFYVPLDAEQGIRELLSDPDGTPLYEVLISFQIMMQGQRRVEYQHLDTPVLQALTWRSGDAGQWRDDPQGIPLASVPFYLAVPEYAGVIDPLVVAAIHNDRPEPIAEQMEAMARKAMRWASLRRMSNDAKKVAIFFYNYPPGEQNMSASFLNVPRSLAGLTSAMATAGYTVTPLAEETVREQGSSLLRPFYRDDALEPLLEQGLAELLPVADYRRWFATLPATVRAQIEERWGEPEDEPMVLHRDGAAYFVVPRIRSGNLVILPQPPRGRRGDDAEKSLYHDVRVPLNHYYLAVYYYVREQFAADALIHFGTHGTQEWTPGKERGLWVYDFPYLVLGEIPVLYPYIVDNIGEATQAKRRGRATIVSYQTPPFTPAGLHQELLPIHDLVHEYMLLDEGAVREETAAAILVATAGDLFLDLSWDAERARADFDTFLHELHDYLHELAVQSQPLGLHTFGQAPRDEHRLSTVLQMLGEPFLARLGLDEEELEEIFVDDFSRLAETLPFRVLRHHLIDGAPAAEIADGELRAQIQQAKIWFAQLTAGDEIPNLLRGLAGRYLETSYGGDPIRNPDSLPTGRNLYPFDPSKLPTVSAFATGKALVDTLIASHRDEHGRAPEKLAFSLWSVEAMRHLGVIEAQVFHAMGVKPVWDQGGRIVGIEVVPREELGRPRVDVVVSATGLYRDHFPNVMARIAEAVEMVAALDEEDNRVWINTAKLEEELLARGVAAAEAAEMARTRIFSSASGTYGSGLDDATQATDTWESEEKLADLYLDRMQYAYGPNQANWGRRYSKVNLFAEQLRDVDAAILARSSNLYGMLTTDDPFQYLGGLSLAVRRLSGQSPSLYISNLRDPSRAQMDSAARFLAVELRTRYFHPGWIEAMQQEGYAGTLNIVSTLNNFWGWQVMDPNVVRDDQWQSFHEVYIQDRFQLDIREWFEQHNPQALAQIVERMLEAVRKDYWEAGEETLRELVATWQELQERHDILPMSSLLEPYVAQLAAGFGLDGPSPEEIGAQAAAPPLEHVVGQQLAPVGTVNAAPLELRPLLFLGFVLAFFLLGLLRQAREQQHLRRS